MVKNAFVVNISSLEASNEDSTFLDNVSRQKMSVIGMPVVRQCKCYITRVVQIPYTSNKIIEHKILFVCLFITNIT